MAATALAFLLPAAAMPGSIRLFALIGSGTLVMLALTPLLFSWCRLPLDRVLYALIAVLAGLGLALMTRLQAEGAGPVAQRQLFWLIGGLAALAGGAFFGRSYPAFCQYRYLVLLAALCLLGLTMPFGEMAGGSRAWLNFGFMHLQPSELARPLVIFFLASYLGQHQPLLRATGPGTLPLWRRSWLLGPVFAMWALSLAFLLLQFDLGTAVLYFGALLTLLYLASGRLSYLAGGTALGGVGAIAAALFMPHVRARFDVWLQPLALAGGGGYQNAQSLFALAAGGILGTGPGRGLPLHIPAVHTDMIFSVIGEELGLAGALAVLFLYLLLIARGVALASRSRDRIGYLFGAGLAFTMGLQILLIASGTIGLLPLTGVTLPLISYGGSSLVSNLFCLGVLSGLGAEQGRRGFAD